MIEKIIMTLFHHYAPGVHATVKAVQTHGVSQPGKVAEEVGHELVHDTMATVHLVIKIAEFVALFGGVIGAALGGTVAVVVLLLLQHFFHIFMWV